MFLYLIYLTDVIIGGVRPIYYWDTIGIYSLNLKGGFGDLWALEESTRIYIGLYLVG